MIDSDTRDRAEIYDLFNRYADAVTDREWTLLDEVFTEDVTGSWLGSRRLEGRTALIRRIRRAIERTAETHLLGNYTATIDGDTGDAAIRVRMYQLCSGVPGRLYQKVLGSFSAKLVRFRHFGAASYARLDAPERLALT